MQSLTKKRWPWIALTVAVMAGAGLALVNGGHPSEAAAEPRPEMTATMGTAVTQEGLLEYRVTSLTCDNVTISNAVPKGRFCTVGITVTNVSDEARKPGISFARTYDSQGAEYLPDAVAEIRTGTALLNDLSPGLTINDTLIYDVPPAATLTSVRLREQLSAPGIRIALS